MVREANVKAASAEKCLVEADMKIDGLETEVAALKTLVLTSTPSKPNKHLHPHLDSKNRPGSAGTSVGGGGGSSRNSPGTSLSQTPSGACNSLTSTGTATPPSAQKNLVVGAGGLLGSLNALDDEESDQTCCCCYKSVRD